MKSLLTRNFYLTAVGFVLCSTSVNAQREGGRASSRNFDRPGAPTTNREGRTDRLSTNTGTVRSDRQSRNENFQRQRPPLQSTPSISNDQPGSTNSDRSAFRNFTQNRATRSASDQNRNRSNRNVTVINNNSTSVNTVNSQSRNSSYNRGNAYRGNSYRGNNYSYNSYNRYNSYRYNYTPRRYVYVGAPRYSILPRGSISIHFGGYPYYYHSGGFYGYYSGYYEPVYAPIGIRVSILPVGYWPIYLGNTNYYYYDGTYYRNYQNSSSEYEVVDAPMGAVVKNLPKKTTLALVNGEKFYEFNGTYYKEGVNDKGQTIYTVVGKYGEINNTEDEADNSMTETSPATTAYKVGDVVTSLPEGATVATINGEKLFVTPANYYFKEFVVNNAVNYKVVGISGDK